MTTVTPDFDISVDKISQLIKKLTVKNVCPCCTARALIVMGAALAENTGGTDMVAEMIEELCDDMSNSTLLN